MGLLTIAAGVWILPRLGIYRESPVPGEILFSSVKPPPYQPAAPEKKRSDFKNPWTWVTKRVKPENWFESGNNDQEEQTEITRMFQKLEVQNELSRLSDAWITRLLSRYPELDVAMRTIPDDRNGYLKWLEFTERHRLNSDNSGDLPETPKNLKSYLNGKATWDGPSARKWLVENHVIIDEIQSIGLIPDRSMKGIQGRRLSKFGGRSISHGVDALLLVARLAAQEGDEQAALKSITAATGLGEHLTEVEAPSITHLLSKFASERRIAKMVFEEIMPALPAGELDPGKWETALMIRAKPPSNFVRFIRGSWRVSMRDTLPFVLSLQKSEEVPDAGEFLDVFASSYIESVRIYDGQNSLRSTPGLAAAEPPETAHLPAGEVVRLFYHEVYLAARSWKNHQNFVALYAAAFSVMKGGPVPNDPIYGLPYQWDPVTRELFSPAPSGSKKPIEPVKIPPF